jgi:hypothetical protein
MTQTDIAISPIRVAPPQNEVFAYYSIPSEFASSVIASLIRFINYPWAYQNSSQGGNSGPITPTPFPP